MLINRYSIIHLIAYMLLIGVFLDGCHSANPSIDQPVESMPMITAATNTVSDFTHESVNLTLGPQPEANTTQTSQAASLETSSEATIANSSPIRQSSEQVTTYKPSRKRNRKKHRKKKKEQQLAIKVIQQDGDGDGDEIKLQEEEGTGEKELTNTLIEKDKQIILATPQVIAYESSARPPVQPVIVRDKGKEKLKNTVDKVEKEIDTVGLSAGKQRSSLESLASFEKYSNAAFQQPVTSLEAYIEFKKNHLENLQKQFANCNDPKLIENHEGRLGLIKLNHTLGNHLRQIVTAKFFAELDKENEFELIQIFHVINLNTATICLVHIHLEYLAYTSHQKENFEDILKYIAIYKQAREGLRMYLGLQKNRFPSVLKTDQVYASLIRTFPELAPCFELNLNSNITPATFKRLHQLETQASFRQKHGIPSITVNENHEQANRFNLPVTQFYNKVCKQVFCVINQPDCTLLSIEKAKEALEQFLILEKEGIEVVASTSQSDVHINNLTAQELVEFYKELAELMPYLNICMFITKGIELSIKAREFEIGLERLRAMEDFYTAYPNLFPAGAEPGFRSYQAKAYALCGNYDKLSELYKNEILKVLAQKRKLAIQHQQKVEKIKRMQQATLASLAYTKMIVEPGIEKEEVSTTTIAPRIASQIGSQIGSQEEISQAAYVEREQLREQEIRNRHKRHQEAEEQRKRGELIEKPTCSEETQIVSEKNREVAVKLQAPSMPQIPSDIHFLLPKRAFKTISKIFTNNWKITRADIENLFEFLGHNIDKATKSSHHIIIISQGITLVRGEEIIGIITDLSATMGGHLSLPSWDKEIPFYMRPQIENLLRAIGINQDNYSKGNSEDYMEFVSVDKNNKHK